MQRLLQWDVQLFIKINTEWTTPFLDNVYPWWRDALTWYPLYVFLFVFTLINFGRKAWPWIIALSLNAAITDQLSSTIIKNYVGRLRPCQNPAMAGHIRMLLNHCSGGFSFPSSHATNHFGAAMFLYCTLKQYIGNYAYLFFVWAATISYGQIYVGVHYPVDVVAGTMLGCLVGYITASFFNRKIGLPHLVTA